MIIKRTSRILVAIAALASMFAVDLASGGTAGASTLSNCVIDSQTDSWQVCITQTYSTETARGETWVAVQNYQVVWTDFVGTNVSVPSAIVHTGVMGVGLNGGLYGTTQYFNISNVVSGKRYTETPSWAGVYVLSAQTGVNYQCGNADATLKHGTSTWALNSPNDCQGQLGFNPFA
jgi:hypothetical protein